MPDLADILSSDRPWELAGNLFLKSSIALLTLAIFVTLPFVVYYLISLPLRRAERARLFLDLVEQGLGAGKSLQQTILEVSATADPALGYRFERVGELIRQGLPWDQSIARVPNFISPALVSTLQAGEAFGSLQRVIPLCRQMLLDARETTVAAVQVLGFAPWLTLPLLPLISTILRVFVAPKYLDLFKDMSGVDTQVIFHVLSVSTAIGFLHFILGAAVLLILVGLVAGPWIRRYSQPRRFPIFDAFLWWAFPWCRNRALRNFGSVLATALDAGIPEAEGVRLAAQSCDNRWLTLKSEGVQRSLAQGIDLASALTRLRKDRELAWRFANSAHSRDGFVVALEGWWTMLEARARRAELTAGYLMGSGFVLVSGVAVGLVCVSYFVPIIRLIEEAVLW